MSVFKSPRTLRILQAGAILAAVGTGYAVRDIKTVDAQGTISAPPPVTEKPVETQATRDAAATQNAFVDVAKSVEPAVVTIETLGTRVPSAGKGPSAPSPFGGAAPEGNGGGGSDQQFRDFFKQFQKQFGFGQQQSFDEGSWQGRVLMEKARAEFQQTQARRGGGLGSGMIYDSNGLILTNAHVVKGADTVTVTLSDGRVFPKARVVGRDERTDIAVVKIPATNLPTVKLGDSDKVRSGEWAIAVGNPFGLDHTLTVGVISAINRNGNQLRLGGEDTRTDYLQTDASINPGNSGGPLLDIYGRVIGINNAIYSESGGNQGIGFAIPINTARFVSEQLAKNGKVRRGYLGVSIQDAKKVSAAFGLPANTEGVLVAAITDPNTPGAKAGLKAGDVIIEFNGQKVTESGELQKAVGNSPVGSQVTLTVLRDGKPVQLKAVLEELPDAKSAPSEDAMPDNGADGNSALQGGTALPIPGLKARDLNAAVARALKIKPTTGIAISEVADNSPAADAGLQAGDVVTKVGQKPVKTVAEMTAEIKRILATQTGDGKQVALQVEREGKPNFVIITLD